MKKLITDSEKEIHISEVNETNIIIAKINGIPHSCIYHTKKLGWCSFTEGGRTDNWCSLREMLNESMFCNCEFFVVE